MPGEPGRCVCKDARASVSIKETFEVRFEPRVLPTTLEVKVLPTLSFKGKRSIDYPAQGSPYNTLQDSTKKSCAQATVVTNRSECETSHFQGAKKTPAPFRDRRDKRLETQRDGVRNSDNLFWRCQHPACAQLA